jgi:hypothetical protein
MKTILVCIIVCGSVFFNAQPSFSAGNSGFIYGTVYTRDHVEYQGRILWDNHESCWEDLLDASHRFRTRYAQEGNRHTVRVFGFRVSDRERRRNSRYITATMAIKFGHLAAIECRSNNSAILELKGGREVKVTSSSTDIGKSNRGIIIEDPDEGTVKLKWRDLDRVEFEAEPRRYAGDVRMEDVYRLCGRVSVRSGEIFQGAIMWDNDETLSTHILDGKEDGHDIKIEFGEIAAIIRLNGSNDVNSGNRGIIVHDPDYGQITIPWRQFEKLEIIKPTEEFLRSYDEFDGGILLHGIVEDKIGDTYEGDIRWDDDESYSCDILDGKYKHFDVKSEFGNVRSIRYRSQQSAIVEFRNKKKLKLTGSNDVGNGNKGVIVLPRRGREEYINWRDFERIEFLH